MARQGSLQGDAMAVGTWRVALHPMAYAAPGAPRGKAELELFVVGHGGGGSSGAGVLQWMASKWG